MVCIFPQDIKLDVDVQAAAQSVRFLQKREVVKAVLLVAPSTGEAAMPSAAGEPQQQEQPPQQQQQHEVPSAATPPPQEQVAAVHDSSRLGLQGPAAAGPRSTATASGTATSGPAAASPREQLDAGLYAAAAEQSKREAAAQFFTRAQAAAGEGDAGKSQRLLEKARRLDPGNPRYQADLRAASCDDTASAGAGGSGGWGAGSAPGSSPAGAPAAAGAEPSQHKGPSAAWASSPGSAAGTRRSDEQRRQQQQQEAARRQQEKAARQQEAAAAGEAAAAALQAALVREKTRRARQSSISEALRLHVCKTFESARATHPRW
jgi:hypothetical protein